MNSMSTIRSRPLLGAAAALLAGAGLLACGGGDELASPVPVATGTGMATVTLDGVDLGSTPLVESGIVNFVELVLPVVDEMATFEGDPPTAVLASRDLASDQLPGCAIVVEDVTNPGVPLIPGPGGFYTIDFSNGTLVSNPDPINGGYFVPDGTQVTVDYCKREPSFAVNVGVSLATGDLVSMTFFNIPDGESGMRSTNVVANSAPPDGTFAFTLEAAENLTQLEVTQYVVVDDRDQNDATIISADLTNQLNPCIEGRVVALVENQNTGEDVILEVNFDDPDCL